MTESRLEGTPSSEQKERLEDFLAEVKLISVKYRIALRDEFETLEFLDLVNERLIGVGLQVETHDGSYHGRPVAYHAADSILDGAWLVDSAEGSVEQHLVGPVFPQRSSRDER